MVNLELTKVGFPALASNLQNVWHTTMLFMNIM